MEPKYMPLITFPWLFEKELGRIATGIEAVDELEDLGLQPLVFKSDQAQSRRRNGQAEINMDDFIQQEDGVIVHRGEELDLFRPDVEYEELSDESDFEQARYLDDGAKYTRGESGELIVLNAFPETLLASISGTGVEEVVPRTQLDGLMNLRAMGRAAGLTTATSVVDDFWPQSNPPKPTRDGRNSSLPRSLIDDDIPEQDPAGKYSLPRLTNAVETRLEAPANNVSSPSAGVLSRSSTASTLPSSEPDVEGEPVVEEVNLAVKESAMERAARMMIS
jgi:RNA-dependent RNA polymerase